MTANREKDYDQLAKELQSEYQDLTTTLKSLEERQKQIYKTISTNRDQMGKLIAARLNGVGNQPAPPMPVVRRALNVGGGTVVRPQNQFQMSQLLHQQHQTTVRLVASTATPITMRPVASTATPITMRPVASTATPITMRPVASIATPITMRPVASTETPTTVRPVASIATPTTMRPVASIATPTTMRRVASIATPTTMRPVASTATPTTMTPRVQKPNKGSGLVVATATGDIKIPTLKLQPGSLDFIKKMIAANLQATTNQQQADLTSTQNPKRKADNGAVIQFGSQIRITKLPLGAKKVKLNPTNIVSNNYIPILPKSTTTSDLKIVEVTGSVKMGDTDSQTVEKIDRRKTKLACSVDPADMLCNPIKSEQDDSDIEILGELSSENNANNSIKVKTEAAAETVKPKDVDKPSKIPQKENN